MINFSKEEDELVMIDVESTGLDIFRNDLTSICLQPFTLTDGATKKPLHYKITHLGGRVPDKGCLMWREEHGLDQFESTLTRLNTKQFLQTIDDLVTGAAFHGKAVHLFAMHTEFDIAFIQGYYSAYNQRPPWNHKNVWEVCSLIKGAGMDRRWAAEQMMRTKRWKKIVDEMFDGRDQPHNAHYDCVWQIEVLRYVHLSK